MTRRHVASPRVLVRPLSGLQLFVDIELLARLEHEHLHALRGHHVRRHPASRSGSDDDGIVGPGEIDVGLGRRLQQSEQVHRRPRCIRARYHFGGGQENSWGSKVRRSLQEGKRSGGSVYDVTQGATPPPDPRQPTDTGMAWRRAPARSSARRCRPTTELHHHLRRRSRLRRHRSLQHEVG